ncbi:MAG: hypothetical protein ACJ74H_19010 [Thermoanaerobaculia bacterium]
MEEVDFKRLLDATMATTIADMRQHVDATAAETREHMNATAAEMRKQYEATAADMRNHYDTTAADMRRHYDLRTERLEDKIQLVVETVALLDAKVDRMDVSIRDEMRRGFADTHDLIRFVYSSLDRRVTRLENGV